MFISIFGKNDFTCSNSRRTVFGSNWIYTYICIYIIYSIYITYLIQNTHTDTSAISVITCARFCLKQMWRLTKVMVEMKYEHWTKTWNYSVCTWLVLIVSWTHGLIPQWVRAFQQNSVIVSSGPIQASLIYLLVKIL